jgi:hypothetical protein
MDNPMQSWNTPFFRILYLASCFLLLAFLSACAGPTTPVSPTAPVGSTAVPSTAAPTAAPAPTATPAPTPTPRPLLTEYPLSGLPADPDYLQAPPLAVMIPSDSGSYGLSQASVVYEAAVEGGIPRYLALFEQVEAGQIGPVRSARPYFVEWACPYGPLFVHWGGSPQALTLLGTSECVRPLDGQTYGRGYYFEEENPEVPWNNQFTSSDLLYGYLQNWEVAREVDFQGYVHQPCADTESPASHTLSLPFVIPVQYTFEPADSGYYRTLDSQPHLDLLTGEPIRASNIAVVYVPQQLIPGDPEGRLEFETSGEGEAIVFTCGRQVPGRWVKESSAAELRLLDDQGREIILAPGSLWIEVLAPGQEVSLGGH